MDAREEEREGVHRGSERWILGMREDLPELGVEPVEVVDDLGLRDPEAGGVGVPRGVPADLRRNRGRAHDRHDDQPSAEPARGGRERVAGLDNGPRRRPERLRRSSEPEKDPDLGSDDHEDHREARAHSQYERKREEDTRRGPAGEVAQPEEARILHLQLGDTERPKERIPDDEDRELTREQAERRRHLRPTDRTASMTLTLGASPISLLYGTPSVSDEAR